MILTNCKLACRPDADSLVIRDGRIARICSRELLPDVDVSDAEWIDLGGKAVVPGFIDAHVHLFNTGLTESGWRVGLAGMSRDETLVVLAAAAGDRGGGDWVVGGGWDEGIWTSQKYLSREELDRVSTRTPIAAVRMDGHLLIVNSPALEMAKRVLTAEAFGALVDPGLGEVREDAAWRLLASIEPDTATLTDALAAAARHAHRLGVTSVHAMMPRERVPVLLSAGGRHRLRVNVYHRVSTPGEVGEIDPDSGCDSAWVRFGGVKAFADGSLGAANAAVSESYPNGGSGKLNHTDESMRAIIERSNRAGWQTAIHAIGDRAIEQVLAAHERVGTSPDLRHRIEHAELASMDQIRRARDLGVALSMQPNFIGKWSGPGSMNERRLGRERDEVSNPLRYVVDAGARLGFGSDGMPMSPLYGMHSAVNGPYASQRISAGEALSYYTEGGAWLSFEEGIKGRLEEGFLADLTVLDRDPCAEPGSIADRRVERVYVDGECVFDAMLGEDRGGQE